MTLTLELNARDQAALEAKAARLGLPVERYALDLLLREVEGDSQANGANGGATQSTLTPRQQAVMRGHGMLAGSGRTVDDFLRERHEEAEREMEQATRRDAGEFS